MRSDNTAVRREGTRGRIVMLVDNGVNGDSRVQKEARSAADAGWDVVLLGKAPGKEEQSWRLGGAQVRLLRTPMPTRRRRHEYRWAPLRAPFAYRPGPLAAYRQQRLRARGVDLNVRLALATRSGSALARLRLVVPRAATRVLRPWVDFRYRQTRALEGRRKRMDSALDRFTTAFW